MRIGFDAKRLFCNFTGLGNYSRTLVKNLQNAYAENEYFLYTTEIREHQNTKEFTDANKFQVFSPTSYFKSYWRSFSLANQLAKDKVNLYHGLSNELPKNIRATSVKSIVTIHDLIFKKYPETYPLLDRKIYDAKFKYACVNADKIIAVSENTKKDVVHYYGIRESKIEVVYQACNPLYYQQKSTDEVNGILQQYALPKNYFLYVGSVEERKNLKLILESLYALSPSERISLVVIGKGGKYKSQMKALCAHLKLEQWVIWMDGFTNIEHLHAFYIGAKALIYPSFYEGFGIPVAEALLSKTPVITAHTSSLPEAGGTHSLYIDPKSTSELSSAMKKVLTNKALVEQMQEEGYKYATQQFSSALLTEKLMKVYQRV